MLKPGSSRRLTHATNPLCHFIEKKTFFMQIDILVLIIRKNKIFLEWNKF